MSLCKEVPRGEKSKSMGTVMKNKLKVRPMQKGKKRLYKRLMQGKLLKKKRLAGSRVKLTLKFKAIDLRKRLDSR